MLPYIPTNNITDLNKLINAGEKLVCEKIGIPSKSIKKQSKPGWEIQPGMQIKKKLRKQTRMIKKEKRGKNRQHRKK